MTALPGWPAVSGAATFQHIRRALAGQVARSSAGVLRTGIFPAATSALVTGTATMNVAVGPFVAVLDRNGAVFLANDGSATVLLSSAPGSGSRWSVVYVKQRESEAPFSDGADGPVIDKVESTTSEAAARALLPAGALELAVVQVNAGAANTNAVGVTITQTALYTAMSGGTVFVRNSTELTAWTPADGSRAYRIDNGLDYERAGGAWYPVGMRSLLTAAGSTSLVSGVDTKVDFDDPGDLPTGITWNETTKEVTVARAGRYKVTATGRFQNNGTGFRVVTLRLNGAIVTQGSGASVSGVEVAYTAVAGMTIAAGDKITVVCVQNSGASLAYNGAQLMIERI